MYTGGCLCGSVRFAIQGPIRNIVYCHCSRCRKAQGSAFATNGIVRANEFTLLSGAELLTGYESSPGQTKYFCKTCGSPILSRRIAAGAGARTARYHRLRYCGTAHGTYFCKLQGQLGRDLR